MTHCHLKHIQTKEKTVAQAGVTNTNMGGTRNWCAEQSTDVNKTRKPTSRTGLDSMGSSFFFFFLFFFFFFFFLSFTRLRLTHNCTTGSGGFFLLCFGATTAMSLLCASVSPSRADATKRWLSPAWMSGWAWRPSIRSLLLVFTLESVKQGDGN